MASDPLNALLLIGMGIREFSLSAPSIPIIKHAIRSVSLKECCTLSRTVLACRSGEEIRKEMEVAREKFGLT